MVQRISEYKRKTKETQIEIKLNLDGSGKPKIDTGINFLNHLLTAFSKHGLFDLQFKMKGDLELGQHHTVEDCGIALGQAFDKVLGDRKGINRTGYFAFPMDDSLAVFAVDISGRPFLIYDISFSKEKEGDLELHLLKEFFHGFSSNLKSNTHIRMLYGEDDHHKAEAMFKAFGKAMKMACSRDPRMMKDIPSTKGLI